MVYPTSSMPSMERQSIEVADATAAQARSPMTGNACAIFVPQAEPVGRNFRAVRQVPLSVFGGVLVGHHLAERSRGPADKSTQFAVRSCYRLAASLSQLWDS